MNKNQCSIMSKNDGLFIDLIFLTLFTGLLFFIFLGSRPLFVPDEGRYAEIAREMLTRNDFITPYLNHIKYFEKPAMFYWLGAIAIKIGGLSEWSLRTINAAIGILGCLATYFTARQLYDRATGLTSALILATSMLYFVMSHMVSLDLPVTVFLSITLYGFLLATRAQSKNAMRWCLYIAAISAACAVLTKGLIGLVFPLMITGSWVLIMNEWRQLKRLPIVSALLIFLLIATPWHAMVTYYNPEFFHFYFIEQHILRYTTKDIGHYQPAWFFIPTLILGFFPWIAFIPQIIASSLPCTWRERLTKQSECYFIIWAVLIFLFFSFSKSKLIPYILPVIPALAILTGRYLALRLWLPTKGIKLGYTSCTLLSIAITCLLWGAGNNPTFPNPEQANLYLRYASLILAAGSTLAMLMSMRRPQVAFGILTFTTAIFLVTSYAAVPAIDSRSIKPLATTLKPLLRDGDEVITYNQYYQDLPFYLERRVSILNWRNELSFGMGHQDTKKWMINDRQFWEKWHGKKRVYVIMSKDEYRVFCKKYPTEKIFIIAETGTNALVTNQPLAVSPT